MKFTGVVSLAISTGCMVRVSILTVIPRNDELSSRDIAPDLIWPFIQSNSCWRVMPVKSVVVTPDDDASVAAPAEDMAAGKTCFASFTGTAC